MPGGEYTHVSDTGPQPVPPGIPRVNLIPVGDGGPGPLLPRVTKRPRRKPFLPSQEEIEQLPHWARIAFAARCAQRVLPIARRVWPADDPYHHLKAIGAAVAFAEQTASTAPQRTRELGDAGHRLAEAAGDAVACAPNEAAGAAAYAAANAANRVARHAAVRAAEAILRVSGDPRDLRAIRQDFERFRCLAKKHKWIDDTPVPPDAVGPLWPPGRTPKWAQETNEPRE
jgi:hypothetical protein